MITMKRKTRVTKEEVIAIREEKKNYNARKAKHNIKSGPWTEIDPGFKVKVNLRPVPSIVPSMAEFFGAYSDDQNWHEKGWYPIIFNIRSDDMLEKITKHGLDCFVAACEQSLCEILDDKGKQLYGDVVILEAHAANGTNKDPTKRFISCSGKTNKKSIKGFTAIRQNKYVKL